MARYLISAIGVNTSAIDVKRAGFGSVLEQREAMHKDGWNVATSQRHDVGLTIYKSQQAATSRRPNVVTSQRRDVPTARRLNVATSQRRDVSATYASQSLKAKRGTRIRGIGDRTN